MAWAREKKKKKKNVAAGNSADKLSYGACGMRGLCVLTNRLLLCFGNLSVSSKQTTGKRQI